MPRLGGMNARDIRMELQGNIDPKIGKVLVGLADRQDHLYQLMIGLAQSLDTMADSLLKQANGIKGMQEVSARVKNAKATGVSIQASLVADQDDDAH